MSDQIHPLTEYADELRLIFGLQLEVDVALAAWLQALHDLKAEPSNIAYFGRSNPTEEKPQFQHWATVAELQDRAAKDGEHSRRLRRMAIVFAYTYWDVTTRKEVAKLAGKPADDIKHPVFGDLRKLRQAVVHVNGRIDKPMETLTFLKKGDTVDLSNADFYQLFRALTLSLNDISRDHLKTDSNFAFDHVFADKEGFKWVPENGQYRLRPL